MKQIRKHFPFHVFYNSSFRNTSLPYAARWGKYILLKLGTKFRVYKLAVYKICSDHIKDAVIT